jgi:hypothetical protein
VIQSCTMYSCVYGNRPTFLRTSRRIEVFIGELARVFIVVGRSRNVMKSTPGSTVKASNVGPP